MNTIKHFILPEHTNTLYQKEAISSISLARDVAEKINELVDVLNTLYDEDLEWKQTHVGECEKAILFMKDNLINSIHDLFTLLTESGELQSIIDNIYTSQVAENTKLLSYLNIVGTPEMFGAKGDGVTDDTKALNYLFASGVKKVVFSDKVYKISSSLVIPSNVSVDFGNSEIVATKEAPMLKIEKGTYNVNIKGGFLNANHKSNIGILVYAETNKININGVTILDVFGNYHAYGIAIPSIGGLDIHVNNCTIDGVASNDNGVIGDKRGWSKGIIVGFDGWLNDSLPKEIDNKTYSRNVTLKNNAIKNVKSTEDGDGIYIEGITDAELNPMMFDLPVIIEGNYFENIGKRFIKVIPCGGVTIRNNYGIITKDSWHESRIHSFVSVYAPNCVIENNEFHCRKNHALYMVDLGVQKRFGEYTAGTVFVTGNRLYNSADREGDLTASIYYADYEGAFGEIYIENNHINSNYYGILIDNAHGDSTKVHINGNKFSAPISSFRAIEVKSKTDLLNIMKNYVDDRYANATIVVDKGNYVNILDNVMTVNIANTIKCAYCLIKNNLLFNIATSRRFNVTASGWYVSVNNNDSAGGKTTW